MNESEFLSLAECSIGELGLELSLDTGRPFVAAVGVLMVDNPREFARAVVARLRHRLGDAWGDLLDDGAAILNPRDSPHGLPRGSFKAHFETHGLERLASSHPYRVAMGGFIKGAASYVMPLAERSINELGLELCSDTKRPFVVAVGVMIADNAPELARAVVVPLRRSRGLRGAILWTMAARTKAHRPAPQRPAVRPGQAYLEALGVEMLASNHPYRVAMGSFIKTAADVFAQGIAEQLRAELGDEWEQQWRNT
jgi:hypothetical protein